MRIPADREEQLRKDLKYAREVVGTYDSDTPYYYNVVNRVFDFADEALDCAEIEA